MNVKKMINQDRTLLKGALPWYWYQGKATSADEIEVMTDNLKDPVEKIGFCVDGQHFESYRDMLMYLFRKRRKGYFTQDDLLWIRTQTINVIRADGIIMVENLLLDPNFAYQFGWDMAEQNIKSMADCLIGVRV